MATDVAHPEIMNSTVASDAPITNGDHEANQSTIAHDNTGAFEENAALSKTDTSLSTNIAGPDTNPGGPTPVEDVAPGIAGVADFIPKGAPASHPTPPPDEPLAVSEANVDVEMTTTDDVPKTDPEPSAPLTSSTESSLVRPREDDDEADEEPAAKRSKVEGGSTEDVNISDLPPAETPSTAQPEPSAELTEEQPHPASTETPVEPDAASKEMSGEEAATKQDEDDTVRKSVEVSTVEAEAIAAEKEEEKPVQTQAAPQGSSQTEQQPASQAEAAPAPASKPPPRYSTEPMTTAQHRALIEKTKNLKKTKNSAAFVAPVDAERLGIPTYYDFIKKPMDIGTMETKLKSHQYQSVQEYADDFDLIIENTRIFNGPSHAVTLAGLNMEAYFRRMMESLPSASQGAPAPKPQAKKQSPKPIANQSQRRESRSAAHVAPPLAASANATSAAAPSEAFALQSNGTPTIRRDSTVNRPARAIKPPARDLPYAKPKRKEHQLELKFCDYVLTELKSTKNAGFNSAFLQAVDPVALNIPNYFQIVKSPMDLGTMTQKLRQGLYEKASDFEKDFNQIIKNCFLYNPKGNPVHDMGQRLESEFEKLWNRKDKWEASKRKAEAQRATSASADEDSGEEEDEEEEEEAAPDGGDPAETIRALQKQLADMQNALAGLNKAPAKSKKAKSTATAKSSHKKAAAAPAPSNKKAAPKAKPKKAKQVTYEEKQEISDAVSKMDGTQVEKLTQIIITNCKKYAEQDEMELEIDDLPSDVQVMLLKYVRSIFGNPTRGGRAASPDDAAAVDDDDFEPEKGRKSGGGGGSKRRKHKPMGKTEQQEAINTIQRQLSQFQNGAGASGSQSPSSYAVAGQDTSGDEESEESEEE